MDIDLPDVVAEVRAAFEAYERALVSNDVEALDALFRDDPRTIRFGGAENLFGYAQIAAFRAARSPVGLARTYLEHRHHRLRPRRRRRVDVVPPLDHGRQGRPADADLGAVSRRLARGGGACERDRAGIVSSPATRPSAPTASAPSRSVS